MDDSEARLLRHVATVDKIFNMIVNDKSMADSVSIVKCFDILGRNSSSVSLSTETLRFLAVSFEEIDKLAKYYSQIEMADKHMIFLSNRVFIQRLATIVGLLKHEHDFAKEKREHINKKGVECFNLIFEQIENVQDGELKDQYILFVYYTISCFGLIDNFDVFGQISNRLTRLFEKNTLLKQFVSFCLPRRINTPIFENENENESDMKNTDRSSNELSRNTKITRLCKDVWIECVFRLFIVWFQIYTQLFLSSFLCVFCLFFVFTLSG